MQDTPSSWQRRMETATNAVAAPFKLNQFRPPAAVHTALSMSALSQRERATGLRPAGPSENKVTDKERKSHSQLRLQYCTRIDSVRVLCPVQQFSERGFSDRVTNYRTLPSHLSWFLAVILWHKSHGQAAMRIPSMPANKAVTEGNLSNPPILFLVG